MEYNEARKILMPLIERDMPIGMRAQKKLSVKSIIESMVQLYNGFEMTITMVELWGQEKGNWIKYGMTGFDAAYCGKIGRDKMDEIKEKVNKERKGKGLRPI
jgi:hypothetical protein